MRGDIGKRIDGDSESAPVYNVEQSNREKYLGIDGYKIRWQGPEVI
jgi:hypothetical protein